MFIRVSGGSEAETGVFQFRPIHAPAYILLQLPSPQLNFHLEVSVLHVSCRMTKSKVRVVNCVTMHLLRGSLVETF